MEFIPGCELELLLEDELELPPKGLLGLLPKDEPELLPKEEPEPPKTFPQSIPDRGDEPVDCEDDSTIRNFP